MCPRKELWPLDRPNILVMMTDQHRFDTLGCTGNARIRTPNLDALAAGGVLFRQACCPTPVCIASRMSLITGRRVRDHHWAGNYPLRGPLPELPTMMTLLQRAGYHTHGVGKMHFLGRLYGLETLERQEEGVVSCVDDDYIMYLRAHGVRARLPQGLRDLLYYQPQTNGIALEHSMSAWVVQRSVACLREHARYRRRPLFLWSSWVAPHPPFAPCEPYDSMYNPEDMTTPVWPERPLETLPSSAWGDRGRLDGAHLDPGRIRRIRALYYGQVSQIDDGVGQILAELDNLGMRENTVVLFISDHGDMLGDHGLSQKSVPYEPAVRVPMILHWPGRTEPGRVCDDLVGLTDFLPTLVEELGLDYPGDKRSLPGASLLGKEGGGLGIERTGYYIDYGKEGDRWVSLRTSRYKYALWATGPLEELYDLQADPYERHNMIGEQPELAREMRECVLRWERENGITQSFDGERFRTYPQRPLPASEPRHVTINDAPWADRLPEDERDTVESYAEAFTRAIAKETTLSPEKLSLADYKRKGGKPLIGTPWEDAWRRA